MKNIKELGLELIELKDQILLVEKINGTCGKWILVDWDEYGYFVDTTEHDRDYGGKDKNVIASTVQLQGLPLLVIADDIDEVCENLCSQKGDLDNRIDLDAYGNGVIAGYNKAKEIYKFTEEDLKKALWELGDVLFNNNQNGIKEGEPEMYFDTIIQSLTKKELWIEVDYDYEEHPELVGNPKEEWYFPKITNNQIKAIWK